MSRQQASRSSHRHVLDYLLAEVLQRQPESVRSFLLHTSLLERLTAPLCDAVLDAPAGSQAVLESLERANLFIVPLDDERRWYRYHRLFADLLRQYLEKTEPDALPALHRRACAWLELHGLLPDAIEHALAAGDAGHAADLAERAAEQTFMRSEVATLLRWLNALPDEHVRARPSLCIYHAWALLIMGQPRAAVLARLRDAEAGAGAIPAEAAVCRALLATPLGDASHRTQAVARARELGLLG
jgi:LuxR family maltose regulon positive regulatory protein